MKKLLMTLFIFICSCKSITYQDVNPIISPNAHLLPALNTSVDIYNLEASYSSGSFTAKASTIGSSYTNNKGFGSSYHSTRLKGKNYKDARVNDVINIFEKEVKENISTPYGAKKGTISLKIRYRESDNNKQYRIVSLLSFGSATLLGFPWDKIDETIEVEVEITNNKKETVKIYKEFVDGSSYVAAWWGYNEEDAPRKIAADNIKQALEKIRIQINTDAANIKKNLK